jgi:O-antigen ligase/polysaccharide polymerase Wzy-like membrane protein
MLRGLQSTFADPAPMPVFVRPAIFASVRDGLLVLAFALPFLAQALPYGFPLFLPVVCLAFGMSFVCRSWSGLSAFRIPLDGFMLLVLLTLALYFYGMLLSDRLDGSVFGDVFNAIGLVLLYIAGANSFGDAAHRERLAERLQSLLLFGTIIGAVAGAAKFALLLRGRRLGFVEAASPGHYPFGTSLISDYNMFALTILCGALIAFAKVLRGRSFIGRLCAGGAFFLLCTVGFFAGSRRFWLVAPLGIIAVLALSLPRLRLGTGTRRLLLFAALGVSLMLVAANYLSFLSWDVLNSQSHGLQTRLLSLLDADRSGAFDERLVRWQFAFSLANGASIWSGQGFDYLYAFSCRFASCASVDYPHNPLLSALLYAGIPGVISVALLLGYVCWVALQQLRTSSTSALWGLLLLVHLPFILISANTVLSIKSFLTCAALCALLQRSAGAGALPSAADRSR